jgi:hypothetical protein
MTFAALTMPLGGAEMIDLGVLPGDSRANDYYVNSRGQVVSPSENSDLCRIPTFTLRYRLPGLRLAPSN